MFRVKKCHWRESEIWASRLPRPARKGVPSRLRWICPVAQDLVAFRVAPRKPPRLALAQGCSLVRFIPPPLLSGLGLSADPRPIFPTRAASPKLFVALTVSEIPKRARLNATARRARCAESVWFRSFFSSAHGLCSVVLTRPLPSGGNTGGALRRFLPPAALTRGRELVKDDRPDREARATKKNDQ